MLKKWVIILVLPLVLLIGCGTTTNTGNVESNVSMKLTGSKPPEAMIKIGDVTYPTKLGTYCWSDGNKGICEDHAGPPELLEGEKPIQVKAGEDITFVMDYEPKPNEVHVEQFKDEEQSKVEVKDNKFQAPIDPGIYYYSYGVWWMDTEQPNVSHGDAFYGFVIEVK